MTSPAPADLKHSLLEDALGILTGTFVVSLGLFLLHSVGAVTGGTAGLSLLLGYTVDVPFGVLFALVNLPFFLLAISKKGWDFTIRSGISIAIVSTLSSLHPAMFGDLELPTAYGVLAGNVLAGVGLLILFRHRSSLGGFNIVALILQERAGLRAGYVQMVLDGLVVLASFAVVDPGTVLISAGGAVLLNLILAMNHRPGRYQGY
ncbi:putative 5xTM membrane YitT family protein [Sediminihabitans luteus]|uniref:Putative 5xTM membrane YitT family protein n=1 Tax=Sediminihabitans luteus TaxID=1138585 RepID=A0A2M9D146_9CELL|nr:YitT family protein [Sediminihabitans luteus]PJJ77931.1 putative 5xTM membrane YitT family protein [Sediminihabitans luteus]GII99711.1 membrane protein [Sediminihabitans luteus]